MSQTTKPSVPNVFFYSEKCEHCKDAYALIKKIGIDKFIFKDVEKDTDLPPMIYRVPSVLTSEMKVYVDDDLFRFLLELENIEPFMVNEMGNTLSDSYSYVDNSGVKLDHSFQFLDKNVKINTPSESDNNKIINYDKFISERDNDLKNING
jgi:glutaredoxin